MLITSATLDEVSLVTDPAIDSARVSEVAASENEAPKEDSASATAEADDIIAYYSDILPKTYGSKCFIVSSDKDFIQLVNDDVIVYRPIEREYYTKDKVKEKFGVLADNFI